MIHQFRVKNFLSIREEQVLDFTASPDKTYEEYTVASVRNYRIAKLGVIYGSNASGKSNILLAMHWLLDFIIIESKKKKDSINIIPFLLDENSRNEHTQMILSFFIEDVRYEYLLELDNTRIYKEEMSYYPTNRKSLIYVREWEEEKEYSSISFGNSVKLSAHQKLIIRMNSAETLTVLSAYMYINIEKNSVFEKLKLFFVNQTMPLLGSQADLNVYANREVQEDEQCKAFICQILSKADFNISDLFVEEKEEEMSDEAWKRENAIAELTNKPKPKGRTVLKEELYFTHKTPFFEEKFINGLESSGTERMYGLAAILFNLIKNNIICLADELESSLHYDLLLYFIKLFLVNSKRGQLIFSTHSLMLLDEKIIRRDMTFFAEKNVAGATEIFKAKDFGLHKDVSILNAYRAGKLGAKPELGSIYLDLE